MADKPKDRLQAQLAWHSLLEAHRTWGRMPLSDLLLLLSVRIEDDLTIQEHGEKAGMIKSVTGAVFDRLGQGVGGRRAMGGQGLIELHEHPEDGRARIPKLTTEGNKFVTQLLAGLVSVR